MNSRRKYLFLEENSERYNIISLCFLGSFLIQLASISTLSCGYLNGITVLIYHFIVETSCKSKTTDTFSV